MNPFDLKAALLARHAQHVVLIHFPIALFITSVSFDVIALWKRNRTLAAAAYYNSLAAAAMAVPALATGLLAWQLQLDGAKLKGNLRLHLVLAVVSSGAIWLISWIRFRARRAPHQEMPTILLVAELAIVIIVGLTAHVGGFLSGVNGPG